MIRTISLALATASLSLLAGCHSNAGYFSANPELTYGPGVVEFPDPLRVYVPGGGRVHAARHVASSWTPPSSSPSVSPSATPSGRLPARHDVPYEYDVIYIEDVTNRSAPPPPGYGTPSHAAPAKYGRRVRRIPGQPLGVEFTD